MVFVPVGGPMPLVGMFLLGGLSYSQFSIVLAEVNDHLEHHHMASAGAHLVAINGVGSVTAPLLVAGAFLWIGNDGYFWVIAAAHAAAGLTVLWFLRSAHRAARLVPTPLAQAS